MSFEKYVLKIKIVDESVRHLYEEAVAKMLTEEYLMNPHKDSGFDLFIPLGRQKSPQRTKGSHSFGISQTKLIDLGIQCAAYRYINYTAALPVAQPFYVYTRSSISKTPFRLANNVGIIDSGYRGNLKAAFDNVKGGMVSMEPFTRLLQICMPNLSPFQVEIVDELDDTSRGAGGFGSTGK